MLNTSPDALYELVQESERMRDLITSVAHEIAREYQGSAYRKDRSPKHPAPENHWFEWLTTITPHVIYDNPKVIARSRRSGPYQEAAEALAAAINSLAPRVNLWKALYRAWVDSAFSYGVIRVAYEPQGQALPEGDQPFAMLPKAYRVAPERWFCDPQADAYDPINGEGRFAGHVWRRDKQDLLDDKRFNREEVELLVADAGLDKWRGKDGTKRPSDAKRGEVIGYEIWVPEVQLSDDPLANGTIFTLATAVNQHGDKVDPRWIRAPRPFYGPRSGPYILIGYNVVSDCPYPLSPFGAVYEQIRELNAHAVAAARSAARRKTVHAANATESDIAEKFADAEDGELIVGTFVGDKPIHTIENPGATKEQYEYLELLRDRRDRVTGLSESSRGAVPDSASATAVADAAAQRDARISMIKRQFTEATVHVLRSIGWHLHHHDTSVLALDREQAERFDPRPKGLPSVDMADELAAEYGLDPREMRSILDWTPEVSYVGGEQPTAVQPDVMAEDGSEMTLVSSNIAGIEFDDLELVIEPMSMERTNEALQQQRVMQIAELYLSAVPVMTTRPDLPWDAFWDMIGQPMNMRDLSDRLLGSEVMEQMKMMGQMVPGAQGMMPGMSQQPMQPDPAAMQQAQMIGNEMGQAVNPMMRVSAN